MVAIHVPVLLDEVMSVFAPEANDRLLDATVGHGGHASAYLDQTSPTGLVVGLDADERALAFAKQRLERYGERFIGINANFANLKDSVTGGGIHLEKPLLFHHILFDLGVGSHQLSDHERGFSFQSQGELTMLYGTPSSLPPAQVDCLNRLEKRLNRLPDVLDLIQYLHTEDLATVIYVYGEERYSRRIASALKDKSKVFTSPAQVAEAIEQAVPGDYRRGRIHAATRTFQAFRIAVNRELEVLSVALPQAVELLATDGVVAVISFHSLEDRIVKHYFRRESRDCICPPQVMECNCGHRATLDPVTRKPLTPQPKEVSANPRARSAKLRAARRLPPPSAG